MFSGANSHQKPHSLALDIPRLPHAAPRLKVADLPHSSSVRARFNYESFFGLMSVVADGHKSFGELPHIPERSTVPGSERVDALITANRKGIGAIIKHIGGIPVRLSSNQGEVTLGRVIETSDIVQGRWELLLRNNSSSEESTVYHSTEEIRNGFLAATALAAEISALKPVTETEQIA
jgi:hypothetical protein